MFKSAQLTAKSHVIVNADKNNWTLPKDKLIKFWLNLDECWVEEKLAKVCVAMPGGVNYMRN
jgi:hypothetical protein